MKKALENMTDFGIWKARRKVAILSYGMAERKRLRFVRVVVRESN